MVGHEAAQKETLFKCAFLKHLVAETALLRGFVVFGSETPPPDTCQNETRDLQIAAKRFQCFVEVKRQCVGYFKIETETASCFALSLSGSLSRIPMGPRRDTLSLAAHLFPGRVPQCILRLEFRASIVTLHGQCETPVLLWLKSSDRPWHSLSLSMSLCLSLSLRV